MRSEFKSEYINNRAEKGYKRKTTHDASDKKVMDANCSISGLNGHVESCREIIRHMQTALIQGSVAMSNSMPHVEKSVGMLICKLL